MAEINLSDSRGRDAVVSAESVSHAMSVRWIDEKGAQVSSRKILRSTVPHDLEALVVLAGGKPSDAYPPVVPKGAALKGLATRARSKTEDISEEEQKRRALMGEVAELMVDGDPEVDIETFGEFLEDSSRVYVDRDKQIVHKVSLQEVVLTPEGEEKERRPKQTKEPNVSGEIPLKWTGKKMKKSQVYNRFVFANKVQITHINGLTYDFLYEMAKQLEDEDSLMLVGGGTKGRDRLLFRRSGLDYTGFLEGRTEGKKYALILHLTNMELKKPAEVAPPVAAPEKAEKPTATPAKKEAKPAKKETPAKAKKKAPAKKKAAAKLKEEVAEKEAPKTKKKATAKKKAVAKKAPAKKKTATKKKSAKKKTS